MAGCNAKYPDLRYLFMRGLIQHERSQRSRHYLKAAAECTSRAVVSLELAQDPIKSVKQARKLEGIGGETCVKLTKLETERNFSFLKPLGGRFVSSAGGILVALLDLTEQMILNGNKPDKPLVIPEDKVREMAEHYSEETFQHSRDEGFCPAWWRLEVLIKRGYIKRRSLKRSPVLQLLPLGKDQAQTLRDRVGLLPQTAATVPKLPSLSPVKLPDKLEFDDELNTGGTTLHQAETISAPSCGVEHSLHTNDRGADGLVLLVDTQEMGGERIGLGELCGLIERRGIVYFTKKLKTGDYSWLWRTGGREITLPCLVERKRADDLAGTLKEGRFWSQVRRMTEWKSEMFDNDPSMDCRLYYILERRPEEYVVQCTDGCQGIGRCGNPTLQQLHMVIGDLKRQPQLLIRETDSLETTVVLLKSLTEELKEGIAEGKFDALLQKPEAEKTTKRKGTKNKQVTESIGSSRKKQPYETDSVDIKSIMKTELDFETGNNLMKKKTEDLSFEEQLALAIEMSKREVPAETEHDKHTEADMNVTAEKPVDKKTDLNMNFDKDIKFKEEIRIGSLLELEDEDEALRIAIEKSKQDVYRHEKDFQGSLPSTKVGATKVAPTFVDGKEEEGNVPFPLMQHHVSAGGSVIYPHTSGYRNIAEPNSYRPKMNRKRPVSSGVSATVCSDMTSGQCSLACRESSVNNGKDIYRPKMNRNRTASHGESSPVGSVSTHYCTSMVNRGPNVNTDKDCYGPKKNRKTMASHGQSSSVLCDLTSDYASTVRKGHSVDDTFRDNDHMKYPLGTRLNCDCTSRYSGNADSNTSMCDTSEYSGSDFVTDGSSTLTSDSSRLCSGKENVKGSSNRYTIVTNQQDRPETFKEDSYYCEKLLKDKDIVQDSCKLTSVKIAHISASVNDSYKPTRLDNSHQLGDVCTSYQVIRKQSTISSTSKSSNLDFEIESTASESCKSKPKKIKLCFTPSASHTQPEIIKPHTTSGRKKKTKGKRVENKTAFLASSSLSAEAPQDRVEGPNKYTCSVVEIDDDNDDDSEILKNHLYNDQARLDTKKVSSNKYSCSVVEVNDVNENSESEILNYHNHHQSRLTSEMDSLSGAASSPCTKKVADKELPKRLHYTDNENDDSENLTDADKELQNRKLEMDDENDDSDNLNHHFHQPSQLNKTEAMPDNKDGNMSDEDLFPGCNDLGIPDVVDEKSVDELEEKSMYGFKENTQKGVKATLVDDAKEGSKDRFREDSVDGLLNDHDGDLSSLKYSPVHDDDCRSPVIPNLLDDSFSSACSGSPESLPDISGDVGTKNEEMSSGPSDEQSHSQQNGNIGTSVKHGLSGRITTICSTSNSSRQHKFVSRNIVGCDTESANSEHVSTVPKGKLDVCMDHTVSDIEGRPKDTSAGKSPTKRDEKVQTIMSVLPHVSAEAARATLKTCGGDVELCVSVLLETGTTGRENNGSFSRSTGVVDLTDSQSQDY